MNNFNISTLEKFKKCLRVKNYSERTVKSYAFYVNQFVENLNKETYTLTISDLNNYLLNYNYSTAILNKIQLPI